MLTTRNQKHFWTLIIGVILFLGACQWEEEVPQAELVELPTAENSVDKMDDWDVRKLGRGYVGGYGIQSDIVSWQKISGFNWVDGIAFRDSGQCKIHVEKTLSGIKIEARFDVSQMGEYPIVYDSDFKKNDEANYLELKLVLKNDRTRKRITLRHDESISSAGKVSFSMELNSADLAEIPRGLTNFDINFQTEYLTFFDKRSNVKPIFGRIRVAYEVPELYETRLYFKSIKLDKAKVQKLLGDNDWNNPDPETGILVKYGEQQILYENTKNSFEFEETHSRLIYHTDKSDEIRVSILDVDYGLNGNDIISDTLIRLTDLEATDYLDIKLKNVNQLLMYCKFNGAVN